jgi:hypothetical protein
MLTYLYDKLSRTNNFNGGGPVFRWAGHVVYHILDFIQKDLNYADSYLLGPNSRAIM